ncbi:MAG: response regulator [Desulfosalsimonadaceae bacterium]
MTPINLLLVDDEKSFVEIISQRLGKLGFNVTCAFNGQDALDLIANDESIDVIIMDISMPGMDGIKALSKIKNKRPLIEIIMLTGHASVPSAVTAMKIGAFDYVIKPCDLTVLIAKIDAAVIRKRNRENKILQIRMVPYITKRERDERISKILET